MLMMPMAATFIGLPAVAKFALFQFAIVIAIQQGKALSFLLFDFCDRHGTIAVDIKAIGHSPGLTFDHALLTIASISSGDSVPSPFVSACFKRSVLVNSVRSTAPSSFASIFPLICFALLLAGVGLLALRRALVSASVRAFAFARRRHPLQMP
jgi:hypothetical protein